MHLWIGCVSNIVNIKLRNSLYVCNVNRRKMVLLLLSLVFLFVMCLMCWLCSSVAALHLQHKKKIHVKTALVICYLDVSTHPCSVRNISVVFVYSSVSLVDIHVFIVHLPWTIACALCKCASNICTMHTYRSVCNFVIPKPIVATTNFQREWTSMQVLFCVFKCTMIST